MQKKMCEVCRHPYESEDHLCRKDMPASDGGADRFDDDWRHECAPGVHFFITRAEAEAY